MRLPAAELAVQQDFYSPLSISLTPYSMVWDWRVSRAGPMPSCWPSCSLLFDLQLFSLSLLFLYRLVEWGWGLRTNRVSISLSGLALPIFFNNNNKMKMCDHTASSHESPTRKIAFCQPYTFEVTRTAAWRVTDEVSRFQCP